MPKVSVIIPCYNQEKYISEAIDSVLAQTFKDYEIIVINDGSTDGSLEIIEQYVQKYPDKIRVINQKNQGIVSARNNAIKEALGEYILPLDGDDMIADRFLEKAYQAIECNKGDIITCYAQYFGKKQGEYILRKPNKYNMSRDNCAFNASLYKKADFEKAGGYDHAFDKGLEDYDFWCNLMYRYNKKFYRIDEILFFYRAKDENESRNLQQCQYTKELRKIMLDKYPAMRYYRFLYSFLHFFIDYKVKNDKRYIKILGVSFRVKKGGN